jgi:hypothetical protein
MHYNYRTIHIMHYNYCSIHIKHYSLKNIIALRILALGTEAQ